MASGSKRVVYAAMIGNLAIAVTKFAAAAWTGSSAMLSEGIHSTVDTSNQAILLLGMKRASRPPDDRHPFGYGMEIYFWAFVVALLIFALGGSVSIYEGIHRLLEPEPIHQPWINFLVLGIAIVIEGFVFRIAWKELRHRQPNRSIWRALRASKDPSVFAIFCEDFAALAGLTVALVGVALAYYLQMPVFDGIASILIGAILVATAVFLARETLSLMTGESASAGVLKDVDEVLSADDRVNHVGEVLTMHLGPREILVAVSIDFRETLSGEEVETTMRELTRALEASRDEISRVFLRPIRSQSETPTPVLP
ncbi:cation diffusion facilitator family transporter [Amorphus orientalis]|uniref:Cation diffusion facilitator family transporter n=1 Tax=Amorphus orientalis TaxID=649198 RepID=A0AAE3VP23_9HYPH|nr:cation diffusion facilitator family transporter [Amorphus orientalis]MDQ0315586.1 cation diffusion facilitator family transporter [Amorphus orientalis]